jgi:hypothetical protein
MSYERSIDIDERGMTHISVLILDELLSEAMEFVEESTRLLSWTVFEDALENSTSVRVSRQSMHFP